MQIEPGIFDLSSEAYHALDLFSRSRAHTLLTKSPAHAKMGAETDANGAMRLGTVWHKLVLGKGDEYAVSPYDRWQSNESKEWVKEQEEAGRTPIKRKDFDIAQAMADRLREQIGHHEIGDVFALPGMAEATAVWKDHDVWCKALIDWLPEDIHALYDLKSCECASPQAFQRTAFQHGYHLQSQLYVRAIAELRGIDPLALPFRFICQETAEPYLVNVIEMSGEALLMAEEQIDKALQLWRRCSETGKWPGYGYITRVIDPPGWQQAQWESQKTIDKLEQAA